MENALSLRSFLTVQDRILKLRVLASLGKSQKRHSGPPGPECPKSLENSQKSLKKVSKRDFSETFFDSVRDFLDTSGREARGDFSETFWGFRARRPGDSCKWPFGSQNVPHPCPTYQLWPFP